MLMNPTKYNYIVSIYIWSCFYTENIVANQDVKWKLRENKLSLAKLSVSIKRSDEKVMMREEKTERCVINTAETFSSLSPRLKINFYTMYIKMTL